MYFVFYVGGYRRYHHFFRLQSTIIKNLKLYFLVEGFFLRRCVALIFLYKVVKALVVLFIFIM